MIERTVTVDKHGCIPLPSDVREALGVQPADEVTLRLVDGKLIIEAKRELGPITARIAAMDLPVSDWATMEHEIEQGRRQ